MQRAKIGLVSAGVVLVLTACAFFAVDAVLAKVLAERLQGQVERAQKLFLRTASLDAMEFVAQAEETARLPEFVHIFDRADELSQRQAAFPAVEARNARLLANGRKADILLVTDARGVVIARDTDPNVMAGVDLRARFKSLDRALRGTANKDIWIFSNVGVKNEEGRMMRVAAAPIWAEGKVAGAVVLGFVDSAQEARVRRDLLGVDVAFFSDGKIHASSFVRGSASTQEDLERSRALAEYIFGPSRVAEAALVSQAATDPFQATLDDEEYVGIAVALSDNAANRSSGAVVLASVDAALRPVRVAQGVLIGLGILAALVAVAAAVATARRFVRPLDAVELGVGEVISGNLDYNFAAVSEDFEGLANALNVMLAKVLGRPEPGEEESGQWQQDGESPEAPRPTRPVTSPVDPAALRLAEEPEADYLARLFREYVAAREAAGLRNDGLTEVGFVAKLRQSETALREKYRCRMVRFQVMSQDGQVTLKPVPIS